MKTIGLLLLGVVALIALASGWFDGPPEHDRNVEVLEAAFPTLAKLGVDGLALVVGDCEYIRYDRGEFLSGSAPRTCRSEPAAAFDETARADIEIISRAIDALGARDVWGYVEYGEDGSVQGGSFSLGDCEYSYDPGYEELPSIEWERVEAVNKDWYYSASLSSKC